jgi:hypothetical protein
MDLSRILAAIVAFFTTLVGQAVSPTPGVQPMDGEPTMAVLEISQNPTEIPLPTKAAEPTKILPTKVVESGGKGYIKIDSELQISAQREGNTVRLNWTRCTSPDFVMYKVVRSATNADLHYPISQTVYTTSSHAGMEYVDATASGQAYYYRVCSTERNGEVWCGNVARVY